MANNNPRYGESRYGQEQSRDSDRWDQRYESDDRGSQSGNQRNDRAWSQGGQSQGSYEGGAYGMGGSGRYKEDRGRMQDRRFQGGGSSGYEGSSSYRDGEYNDYSGGGGYGDYRSYQGRGSGYMSESEGLGGRDQWSTGRESGGGSGMRGSDSGRGYQQSQDFGRSRSGWGSGQGYEDSQFGSQRGGSFSGTSEGGFRGKGPKGYTRSDERIKEDISEKFSDDDRLDASEIEVEVISGEVTLSGHVNDRSAKRRAEDMAEQCTGVNQVQNNIRVQSENGKSESQSMMGTSSSKSGTQQSASGSRATAG